MGRRNLFRNVRRRCLLAISVALPLLFSAAGHAQTGHTVKRPNILFAISDDQSYPYASAYGSLGVRTPAFDHVAREGVLFTSAFVASPGCSPSRAAFLTGRYPWQIEAAGTHASSFPAKYVTFPDLLERAGYFIGHTGKGWGPGNWQVSGRARKPAGPAFNAIKAERSFSGSRAEDYAGNFADFLRRRPAEKPFYFWYGAHEPHRPFEKGAGLKAGKKLADALVPAFLPDTPEVRSDLLDYAVEIERFDEHLGRMLKTLHEAGELDNTIVIVTSDNGMAFPRAKANCYEYGLHVPLAIRWGNQIVGGGRSIDDVVSLVDLTPTILEAAGVRHPGQYPMAGRSLLSILRSQTERSGRRTRTAVFAARERHSSARYNNLGYPQRAIRTSEYLFIRNFAPERWPAGDPQKYEDDGTLGQPHGAYHDIDPAPTLDFLIAHREKSPISRYFHLVVDKRSSEELFDIRSDPGCLRNLANDPAYAQVKKRLRAQLNNYLRKTGDPRSSGGGENFETHKRYSPVRRFPKPQ